LWNFNIFNYLIGFSSKLIKKVNEKLYLSTRLTHKKVYTSNINHKEVSNEKTI